jgi:ferritin
MIGNKMKDAINKQIQVEFVAAYLYLAMSAYCKAKNFPGFAHWLEVQYEEETGHAMKLFRHLLERGGKVTLQAIEAPPADFGSPIDIFAEALAHEQHVTALINCLYETALEEKDYASQIFLQWFVSEQVEEEANVSAILEKLKMLPDKSGALLYIDKELGKRE